MRSRLKRLIDASGYRQGYIAEKCGLADSTLSHYVTGRKPLPQKHKRTIAKILRVRMGDL
jgi:transcriptional regulator with XRE-family HTH domain